MKFVDEAGQVSIVLIEWKYIESYSHENRNQNALTAARKTNRYFELLYSNDSPVCIEMLSKIESLFTEPFYQFMRQQLLATMMEAKHEGEADTVSLLHIAPFCNEDFKCVTSDSMKGLGKTAVDVWKKLVIKPGRFTSVYTEDLYGKFAIDRFPELKNWWEYISTRYAWVIE